MASKTHVQAKALLKDLDGATGRVAWPVGKMSNALLAKAQEEEPSDAVLSAIEPFRPGAHKVYIENMQAQDVRAIIGQIVAATDGTPSMA